MITWSWWAILGVAVIIVAVGKALHIWHKSRS